MTTTQIDKLWYFRIYRYNGISKAGRVKYHKRKSIRAAYMIRLFGREKLIWWLDKAQKQDKPFCATKKELYRIVVYRNRMLQ